MIRVTVQLDRFGLGYTNDLGVIEIGNDGTGTKEVGNYDVRTKPAGGRIQKVRVEGHQRDVGWLPLVAKALTALSNPPTNLGSSTEATPKRLTAETRIGPGCVAPPAKPEPALDMVDAFDPNDPDVQMTGGYLGNPFDKPEPAAPAVGEDEALLAEADGCCPLDTEPKLLITRLAARLRAALADVARLQKELRVEKDYTESAYLAAREAGEACGKARDDANEARAALAAAVAEGDRRVAEDREALLDFISKEKRQSAGGSDYWNALDSVSVFVRARAGRNDG